jgi:dihydroorotase
VGLETLLPAALSLHHDGDAELIQILAALTSTPARLLGLAAGTLAKGAPADLALLDIEEPFVVDQRALHSRARNTAFEGRKFQGRGQMTFVDGECVFSRIGDDAKTGR